MGCFKCNTMNLQFIFAVALVLMNMIFMTSYTTLLNNERFELPPQRTYQYCSIINNYY